MTKKRIATRLVAILFFIVDSANYFTSSNLTIYDYQYIGITWYKYGYSNS